MIFRENSGCVFCLRREAPLRVGISHAREFSLVLT